MTTVYLIRHAEAEGNLFRMAHGQYDSNLTPRGYRQLHYLRERFAAVRLDAVYGSDLTRAHATASALYVPRQLPFQPLPQLREVRLGDWEERPWAVRSAISAAAPATTPRTMPFTNPFIVPFLLSDRASMARPGEK